MEGLHLQRGFHYSGVKKVRIPTHIAGSLNKFGNKGILAIGWVLVALAMLYPAKKILDGTFPIFTVVWLVVPLIAILRNRDSSRIGIQAIRWMELFKFSLINLAFSLALTALFEPWSHTYQVLFSAAITGSHPDTTFGWLVRFPGLAGWGCFVLFAGLVTIFAEELFFRGWLLHWLQSLMSHKKAILLQATLFTLPQILAAFLLPPVQGILYVVIYSWLATGLIGGWVASRTQTIWPSLVSATIYNLIMAILSS
jgi:membrane protease YdiL (CAAX protease family)